MNVPQLRFKGFEGEWKETTIEQEVDFFDHKRRPVTENLRSKGIYPYYGATGVIDYVDGYVLEGDFLLLAEDGANIITRSAPVVYKTEGKFWVNNHAHVLKPIQSNDFNFFHELLESINYIKFNSGTAQPKLNLQNVKKIPIHISESSEQIKIGKFFGLISERIEKQQEKIKKLEQFKKGMMQKIFSQELRFKDEDGEEFPEWKRFKLGDIAIIKGRLGWKGLKQEEYVENGAYLVAGKHINKGIIQWDKCDQITDFRYKESIEIALEENDVIFSKDGSLGNPAIVKNLPKEATINSTMMLVRMIDEVIPDYLYQVLLGADFKRLIHLKVSGSSIPHLFQADMKDFEFLAPTSVKEQEKIRCILKNLDAKIKKENEKLLAIKEQKKGFMEGIFI